MSKKLKSSGWITVPRSTPAERARVEQEQRQLAQEEQRRIAREEQQLMDIRIKWAEAQMELEALKQRRQQRARQEASDELLARRIDALSPKWVKQNQGNRKGNR